MAHPDDLELLALPGIAACCDTDDRSFTGIVCTDGAGSIRDGVMAGVPVADLVERRWEEQCQAAELGRYGAVVGLDHTSDHIRSAAGHEALIGELFDLVDQSRPANVYTHNPADKHPTHVAVVAALVKAIRRMPWGTKPHRLVGVEAWRDLDWLPDAEKIRLDVSEHTELASQLIRVFTSQVGGGKRYDLAAAGRRRANATMADPLVADTTTEVLVAMDLSPLIHNDDLDPVRFLTSAVDRFRAEVEGSWGQWF